MTNDYDVIEIPLRSIPQAAGSVLTIIVGIVALSMFVLFIFGLAAKFRAGRPWILGWWLRNLSIWTVLLSIFSYASFWVQFYGHSQGGGILPEIWTERNYEAYARFVMPAFVALIGWTFGMILGPAKEIK